jgi:formate dehydrogenase accessory protein FdhE
MPAKNVSKLYDQVIRRAEKLTATYPFAQEILTFYIRIAEFQKSLRSRISSAADARGLAHTASSLRDELHADSLLPWFKEFLGVVAQSGPAPLADSARQLSDAPSESRADLLSAFWNPRERADQPNAAFDHFLARAFLQPYAEHLAERLANEGSVSGFPSLCPFCGARPLLGVLRQEGDGGKRFLMCSLCLREWEFRRIFCATCAEETEAKLPVYVAEQFPYIRVEACDTCKFYLRTIDLTKDGNAVPLVDDLAAIPLSLWAEEHGYSRAQPNLLGT